MGPCPIFPTPMEKWRTIADNAKLKSWLTPLPKSQVDNLEKYFTSAFPRCNLLRSITLDPVTA